MAPVHPIESWRGPQLSLLSFKHLFQVFFLSCFAYTRTPHGQFPTCGQIYLSLSVQQWGCYLQTSGALRMEGAWSTQREEGEEADSVLSSK